MSAPTCWCGSAFCQHDTPTEIHSEGLLRGNVDLAVDLAMAEAAAYEFTDEELAQAREAVDRT